MTAPFKKIKCPIHKGVIIGRIDLLPDGKKVAVFWTRTVVGPDRVLGGRKAEPVNETHLMLDDERIIRGKIPYVVTWCPRCSREYVLPIEWLLDEGKHSGAVLAPPAVLNS